jgi:hypothetical protein
LSPPPCRFSFPVAPRAVAPLRTRLKFAAAWTKKFRVVTPYHPGFGPSADDPAITDEAPESVAAIAEFLSYWLFSAAPQECSARTRR